MAQKKHALHEADLSYKLGRTHGIQLGVWMTVAIGVVVRLAWAALVEGGAL